MIDRLKQSYFISHRDARGYEMSGYPIYHFKTGQDAVVTAKLILSDLGFGYTQTDHWSRRLFRPDESFTRSNGTIIARLYERLTKASRRRDGGGGWATTSEEDWYRQGVYDAYKALQEELS